MNSESLFREKAISHKLLGPNSEPVLGIEDYSKVQLCFWLILLSLATFLLTKTTYRETVSARGVLQPTLGVQKIVSPVFARVESIHVTQGDHVVKGDVLAFLSTEYYDAEGVAVNGARVQQLQFERELLQEQISIQNLEFEEANRWNSVSLENTKGNKRSLESEAELLTIQKSLSDKNLHAVSQLLHTGNSSVQEYDRQYLKHLEILAREQTLIQRLNLAEKEIASIENRERLAQLEIRRARLNTERELQAITQDIETLSSQTLFSVVAEESGVVAELDIAVGNPVQANMPLLFIHPTYSKLEAVIYVPASVQAKLERDTTVLLRYDAFDYRLFGRSEATISAVGQAPLDPRESALPIAAVSEPVFKVTATLHQSAVGSDISYPLRAGGTLFADFVIAEMSLLEFIFKPVLGLRGKIT